MVRHLRMKWIINKRILWQFYAKIFDNLDEINKFLKKPKLTQEEIENLNGAISIKELNSFLKTFPPNR